jgi:hypothetical protein
LYDSAKRRAAERGLSFDKTSFTREYVRKLVAWSIGQHCGCCGNRYADLEADRPGNFHPRMNALSLDCFLPELGYAKYNVLLLCYQCNFRKSTHTIESLRQMLSWMERAQAKIEEKKRSVQSNR